MKATPLNYELRIFYDAKENKPEYYLEFFSEGKDLAYDHARQILIVEKGIICHFRKKGNVNWKIIAAPNAV